LRPWSNKPAQWLALACVAVIIGLAGAAFARDIRTGSERHFARLEADPTVTTTTASDTPAALVADLATPTSTRTRRCHIRNKHASQALCWFLVDAGATCTASRTCNGSTTDGVYIGPGEATGDPVEFSGALRLCGVASAAATSFQAYCDPVP